MVEKLWHLRNVASVAAPYSRIAAGAKGWLAAALGAAAGFVYPPACPACRGALAAAGGLCPDCWREVTFIAGPACRACGAPVLAEAGEGALCDGCVHAPPAWEEGRAAAVYDGAARRLILALKHGDRLDVAPLAGAWMARAGAGLIGRADLIAPAPLHWTRMARRRFNQSAELARAAAAAAGRRGALAPDLLLRTRRTATQDGRSRAARHENVSGAFAVAPRWRRRIRGRRVLIVDDVMTTGATLSACAEAARAAGAAGVDVLVFARVARPDWPT